MKPRANPTKYSPSSPPYCPLTHSWNYFNQAMLGGKRWNSDIALIATMHPCPPLPLLRTSSLHTSWLSTPHPVLAQDLLKNCSRPGFIRASATQKHKKLPLRWLIVGERNAGIIRCNVSERIQELRGWHGKHLDLPPPIFLKLPEL